VLEKSRKKFNKEFSKEKYQKSLQEIEKQYPDSLRFRIAETPLFLPKDFEYKLRQAGETIIEYLLSVEFKVNKKLAIPENHKIPGDEGKPTFIAIDFAVSIENNQLCPKLIELQGFPSLFGFQHILPNFFNYNNNSSPYFEPFTAQSFVEDFGELLINNTPIENCILLELKPENQKTKIDFDISSKIWGLNTICVLDVFEVGNKLYYLKNGAATEIKRIYNRLILEELENSIYAKELKFNLKKEYDVSWVNHPNWYYYISKHCLPNLNGPYFPKSYYLNNGIISSLNLKDFVLKPLYSFAGKGVDLYPTPEKIDSISDPENYIIQEKVSYFEGLISPEGDKIKSEIRLLYIWNEDSPKPILCTNLVRLSNNSMIGTSNNLTDEWVGASIAYFENI
jgi:hypothetical protein